MCMTGVPACMSMNHTYLVPTEVSPRAAVKRFGSYHMVFGIEP